MGNKYKKARFFGIYAVPNRKLAVFLKISLFLLLIATYLVCAQIRHVQEPADKLLPLPGTMLESTIRMIVPDEVGESLFLTDTYWSLRRLVIGLLLATTVGFVLGLNMGMLPGIRELTLTFTIFLSNIPPLAILPIFLIVFGIDELSKLMLIFIGTFPFISRDVYLAVKEIPIELRVKAQTLGASQFGLAYRVVMPQVMPRLLESVRLQLGATWLFLIASEMIAASEGLGYRIYLSTRNMSMDVIIPYVLWITFLAVMTDRIVCWWISYRYPWYGR